MKSILDLLKDKPEITPDPVVQPLIPSITILPTIPEVVDEDTNTELIHILDNLKKKDGMNIRTGLIFIVYF